MIDKYSLGFKNPFNNKSSLNKENIYITTKETHKSRKKFSSKESLLTEHKTFHTAHVSTKI